MRCFIIWKGNFWGVHPIFSHTHIGSDKMEHHGWPAPPPHRWLENPKLACKARHFPKRRWWLDWGQDKKRWWWTDFLVIYIQYIIVYTHYTATYRMCMSSCSIQSRNSIGDQDQNLCLHTLVPLFWCFKRLSSFTPASSLPHLSVQEFRRKMAKQVVYRWVLYVQDSDIFSV